MVNGVPTQLRGEAGVSADVLANAHGVDAGAKVGIVAVAPGCDELLAHDPLQVLLGQDVRHRPRAFQAEPDGGLHLRHAHRVRRVGQRQALQLGARRRHDGDLRAAAVLLQVLRDEAPDPRSGNGVVQPLDEARPLLRVAGPPVHPVPRSQLHQAAAFGRHRAPQRPGDHLPQQAGPGLQESPAFRLERRQGCQLRIDIQQRRVGHRVESRRQLCAALLGTSLRRPPRRFGNERHLGVRKGELVGVHPHAPVPGRLDQLQRAAGLAPVASVHRPEMGQHADGPGALRDIDGLGSGFDQAVALAAHVGVIHAPAGGRLGGQRGDLR